jgi:hypothetical protein
VRYSSDAPTARATWYSRIGLANSASRNSFVRLIKRLAGWARLQLACLTIGDDEAWELMHRVTE